MTIETNLVIGEHCLWSLSRQTRLQTCLNLFLCDENNEPSSPQTLASLMKGRVSYAYLYKLVCMGS